MLDGEPAPETLMQMVKATLKANPNNSVIGFKDNSSAIRSAFLFLTACFDYYATTACISKEAPKFPSCCPLSATCQRCFRSCSEGRL